ncbi:MAG: hypothetical protein RL173_387 [Fibrobacterota bacterium]
MSRTCNKSDFFVCQYEHIDNLYHQLKITDLEPEIAESVRTEEKCVVDAFRDNGWEGDGVVGLFWIPSFLDQSIDPNYGQYVWHVKQSNNGTSFIGFKRGRIPASQRLADQNEDYQYDLALLAQKRRENPFCFAPSLTPKTNTASSITAVSQHPKAKRFESFAKHINVAVHVLSDNKFHAVFVLISISLMIFRRLCDHMPPIINLNAETVNYYWDILINVCISYIASIIFYLVVVYFPEQRRNNTIRTKTHMLIVNINSCMTSFLDETFNAFDYRFEETEELAKLFHENFSEMHPFKILKASIAINGNFDYYENEGGNRYDIILRKSETIIQKKNEMVAYLPYLNKEELDFYAQLEDAPIFRNMKDLETGLGYEFFFYESLDEILALIRMSEKILKRSFVYHPCYEK